MLEATIRLYHDGHCPLCALEVKWLKRLPSSGKVEFIDIAEPAFDEAKEGRSYQELMAQIHARIGDEWVVGADAFRAVYSVVGLGPLVKLSTLPGIRSVVDAAYRLFAKHRLRMTGRSCDEGVCTPSKS